MKHFLMLLAALALFAPSFLFAQGEEEDIETFFVTTPVTVSTPSSIPVCQGALLFDLETIDDDGFLDISFGRAVGSSYPDQYGIVNYNNGSGEFPNQDSTFFFRFGDCGYTNKINDLVFGKLRTNVSRKDLAFLCDDSTFIFLNTGTGIEKPRKQALAGKATAGSWGAFNYQDEYYDLVVTNGTNEVRLYNSNNDGTVSTSPTTLSIAATQVAMAQLDDNLHELPTNNKWDLVSFYQGILSIRLNDNDNGFNSPDTINLGYAIDDIAVGDLNDDGYNDIAVASYSGGFARVYLNNTSGAFNHTPAWSVAGIYPRRIVIGDLGSPEDASKCDGLNDLVILHPQIRRVYINHGSADFVREQSFSQGSDRIDGKVLLADVQNTGGLSLVYRELYSPILGTTTMDIKIVHHVGDPAPAPPKNVVVVSVPRGYGNYNDAKVTWRANTERDLAGYELWRRVTGICGNGTWYLRAELDGTETEYIDQLGTVMENGECLAEYKLLAIDAEDHESDFSAIVEIEFGSDMWKGAGGKPDASSVPVDYALHAAYPNPFNPSTEIKFDLPEDGFVTLHVFDVLGRKVGEIVNRNYAAGYHSTIWNAANLASGVYFLNFTATDANRAVKFSKMSKLILTK